MGFSISDTAAGPRRNLTVLPWRSHLLHMYQGRAPLSIRNRRSRMRKEILSNYRIADMPDAAIDKIVMDIDNTSYRHPHGMRSLTQSL